VATSGDGRLDRSEHRPSDTKEWRRAHRIGHGCSVTNHAEAHLEVGPHAASDDVAMPAIVWRFSSRRAMLSSAPVGGGSGAVGWIVNARVAADYHREDLDQHAMELADHFRLVGPGITMFTAADVTKVATRTVDGISVSVTVGISRPTWAADPTGGWSNTPSTTLVPGTINVVAQLPVSLRPAAAVNAVITITEAKTQALLEQGVPGTGTASDAVTVCWPDEPGAESFCGPRSRWGAPLAVATHAAVLAGIAGQRRWEAARQTPQ
jgi:adenosylcobinamide hydrolase